MALQAGMSPNQQERQGAEAVLKQVRMASNRPCVDLQAAQRLQGFAILVHWLIATSTCTATQLGRGAGTQRCTLDPTPIKRFQDMRIVKTCYMAKLLAYLRSLASWLFVRAALILADACLCVIAVRSIAWAPGQPAPDHCRASAGCCGPSNGSSDVQEHGEAGLGGGAEQAGRCVRAR